MNILVTGSTGFIGKHLCAKLIYNHKLFYVKRGSRELIGPYENVFYFDNNIDDLSCYIKLNKIDGVIHLASLYIQAHSNKDISELIKSNVYFSVSVLQAAADAGTKWFINVGTIWQNFNVDDFSDEYNPVNLYSATKQAFIDIAKYYIDVYDIKFCTLKLCDTYGPEDTRRKIFSIFDEISKSGLSIDMSPGYQRIDILHVDDVVSGFVTLIKLISSEESLKKEYVLTSGNPMTLRELAQRYETKYDVKLNINWGGRPYRKREVMNPYKGTILPNWEPTYFI